MLESGGGGCVRAERACITHVAPDDKPLIPSALIFHNRITGAAGGAGHLVATSLHARAHVCILIKPFST